MSSFNAQATVFKYEFDNAGLLTVYYLIQSSPDWSGDQLNGYATLSVGVDFGDSTHDIHQAVAAAIQSNPATSPVPGPYKIEFLV